MIIGDPISTSVRGAHSTNLATSTVNLMMLFYCIISHCFGVVNILGHNSVYNVFGHTIDTLQIILLLRYMYNLHSSYLSGSLGQFTKIYTLLLFWRIFSFWQNFEPAMPLDIFSMVLVNFSMLFCKSALL